MKQTNFFTELAAFLNGKSMHFTVSMKGGKYSQAVTFIDASGTKAGPVLISGTPETMDEQFITTIELLMPKINEVLKVDASALEKGIVEIKTPASSGTVVDPGTVTGPGPDASTQKKAPVKKEPPLLKREEDGLKRAVVYFEAGEFDKAEVQIKNTCKNSLDHPKVAELLNKVMEAQNNVSESTSNEDDGDVSDTKENTLGEEKIKATEEDTLSDDDDNDKTPVVNITKKTQEPTLTAPAKEEASKKEEKKTEAIDEKALTHDEEGNPLQNIVLIQRATEYKDSRKYAQARVCLEYILKGKPDHIVAKTKLAELDKLEGK